MGKGLEFNICCLSLTNGESLSGEKGGVGVTSACENIDSGFGVPYEDWSENNPDDVRERLLDGISSDFALRALESGFGNACRRPLGVFSSELSGPLVSWVPLVPLRTRFVGVNALAHGLLLLDIAERSSENCWRLCRFSIRRSRIPLALESLFTARLRNRPPRLDARREDDGSADSGSGSRSLGAATAGALYVTSVSICNLCVPSVPRLDTTVSSTQSAGVGGTWPRDVPKIGGPRERGTCNARLDDASDVVVLALRDLAAGGGPGGGGGSGIPGSQLFRGDERSYVGFNNPDDVTVFKAPVEAALLDDGACNGISNWRILFTSLYVACCWVALR